VSYLVVVPSIYQPYTEDCLASARFPESQVLVVDNTGTNRGVGPSWNIGARRVVDEGLDWLVVCSAATRFGPAGGLDFVEAVHGQVGATAVEGDWGLGWHLIAFARRTFQLAGFFDENFWPAYYEDVDFSHRVHRAGLATNPGSGPWWPKVECDAYVKSFAHGMRYAKPAVDGSGLDAYLHRKWGPDLAYEHPFNDPDLPVSWWPTPPDPRALIHPDRPETP
jgi:hypothetical protein